MEFKVCAGRGQRDTRAFSGLNYDEITFSDIVALARAPHLFGAKDEGYWIIPSVYIGPDARTRRAQATKGQYAFLWADIDEGRSDINDVANAVWNITQSEFLIYTSPSHDGIEKFKYRILLPLEELIPGANFYYECAQTALNNALATEGLIPDRANQGPAQICYLPNPQVPEAFRYIHHPTEPYRFRALHPFSEAVRALITQRVDEENNRPEVVRSGKLFEHSGIFNAHYTIEELLTRYGFVSNNGGRDWRHPSQTSPSYGTRVWEDEGWSTRSETVRSWIGEWGDAFDLFVRIECQGNRPLAEACSKALQFGWELGQDPMPILQQAQDHGCELFCRARVSGEPAGHMIIAELQQLAIKEAEHITQAILSEESTPQAEGEWDIEWPPGQTGLLAKFIYANSKKQVKQYAITMAFYLLAGLAGRRYLVNGTGLNLYFVIGGATGTGKGQSKAAMSGIIDQIAALDENRAVQDVFGNDFPASGSGLRKLMGDDGYATKACYRDDADSVLEQLCDPGGLGKEIKDVLVGLWDKSSEGAILGGRRQSKQEDSTAAIMRPTLSIALDTQLGPFKKFLGSSVAVTSGLATRMILVEYDGLIKPTNRLPKIECPQALLQNLARIWTAFRQNPLHEVNVQWEPEATQLDYAFDEELRKRINLNIDMSGFLNRTNMNINKVAALLATVENCHAPVITTDQWLWAKAFVLKGADRVVQLVEKGEAGAGESVRMAKLEQAMRKYVQMSPTTRANTHRAPKSLAGINEVFPHRALISMLKDMSDFKGTDNGYSSEDLVEKTIEKAIRYDVLSEISREFVAMQYNVVPPAQLRMKLYTFGSNWE